jgi:hypothetical protein
MTPTKAQLNEIERIQTIYDDLDREATLREENEITEYQKIIYQYAEDENFGGIYE